jgi:hypothetical protein
MAPASTGKESSSRIAVIKTDQTNKGIWSIVIPGLRMLMIVEIKLIAPRIEETPAKCKEKMAMSTAPPGCPMFDLRGG